MTTRGHQCKTFNMIQHDQAKPEVDSELRNSLLFLILPLTFMTKVFKLVNITIYDGLSLHKKKKIELKAGLAGRGVYW